MANNPFQTIRQRAGDTERSVNWYRQQISKLNSLKSPNKLMSNAPELTNTIMPGSMYMFFYDAKYKDVLPYFDMFPLVIPFRKVPGGFLGINLHYLPYALRFKMLGFMHDYATDEKTDENTKIRLTWNMINSSSRLDPVKVCVKHYLFDHLQSRFLQIKYPDWTTASLMPVERFSGANKDKVWRDSITKINGFF